MDTSDLIRSVRRRRGLSQAQLARRAGTSQPVISAYEHGHRDPTTGTLRRLVAAAGDRLVLGVADAASDVAPPASPEEHAERLVDVLLLADAIGHRPRAPLAFPRISST